jgi:hypothetical protein
MNGDEGEFGNIKFVFANRNERVKERKTEKNELSQNFICN